MRIACSQDVRSKIQQLLKRRQPPRSVKDIQRTLGLASYGKAYRICVEMRVKGQRFNRSRYGPFWAQLNWRLPNPVLASIWQVHRSNVRARRLRLGIDTPAWDADADCDLAAYRLAVAAEEHKADSFDGPRPDPAQRRPRGAKAVTR